MKGLQSFKRIVDNLPYEEFNEYVGYTYDNLCDDINNVREDLGKLKRIEILANKLKVSQSYEAEQIGYMILEVLND